MKHPEFDRSYTVGPYTYRVVGWDTHDVYLYGDGPLCVISRRVFALIWPG